MKRTLFTIAMSAMSAFALAACSHGSASAGTGDGSRHDSPRQGIDIADGRKGLKSNNSMKNTDKTLVVYFSYTAGNTKRIAEKVSKALGADIVALEPEVPYSKDYDKVVEQGEEEVKSGYRPKLKPLGVNLNDYSRIIVGSPTWWYAPAPVVMSFLDGHDLHGKTVIPFMTNAGWPGHVIKDMTGAAERNGAKVAKSHEFRFSASASHRSEMTTPEAELDKWIDSLR